MKMTLLKVVLISQPLAVQRCPLSMRIITYLKVKIAARVII